MRQAPPARVRKPVRGTEIAAFMASRAQARRPPWMHGWTRTGEGEMGLFDRHDYGRDYRAEGRGMGERMRGAWNHPEPRMGRGMHGYDREMRHGGGGYGPFDFAYRGLDDAWSTARNRGAHDVQWDWRRAGGSPFDQDTSYPSARGYGRDYSARGPMGGYGGGPFGAGPGGRRPDRYDAAYRDWGGWREGRGHPGAFRGWGRGPR
jgi:hypothetical protein